MKKMKNEMLAVDEETGAFKGSGDGKSRAEAATDLREQAWKKVDEAYKHFQHIIIQDSVPASEDGNGKEWDRCVPPRGGTSKSGTPKSGTSKSGTPRGSVGKVGTSGGSPGGSKSPSKAGSRRGSHASQTGKLPPEDEEDLTARLVMPEILEDPERIERNRKTRERDLKLGYILDQLENKWRQMVEDFVDAVVLVQSQGKRENVIGEHRCQALWQQMSNVGVMAGVIASVATTARDRTALSKVILIPQINSTTQTLTLTPILIPMLIPDRLRRPRQGRYSLEPPPVHLKAPDGRWGS